MGNRYTEVRRRWRDVDPERDLKALWTSEHFEDPARVHEGLRVTELAIRVAGWDTVKSWARTLLADGAILNAHLVELAMRALERGDDAFLGEVGDALLGRSPPNYFRFWFTLFTAKHSHRGERLFRAQLAASVSDYQAVKYRRWLRKIFRKLRFRCETPRERALGAIAFGEFAKYKPSEYRAEAFDAFVAAQKTATNWPKDKNDKPISGARQAGRFSEPAAQLGIWSVAEGIRTAARIPRTLEYLAAMAPRMTDGEVIRALKGFDAHLGTADHKKASDQVLAFAQYLSERLGRIEVPLEEWCKVLPYVKSPVLARLLEELITARLETAVAGVRAALPWTALGVVDSALDARGFRVALLLAYVLHRAGADASLGLINAARAVSVLSHPSPLWPYGVGAEPPVRRFEPEPDHPHRAGFTLMRQWFPSVAQQASPSARPLDATLRALRYQLYRRALLDREAGADDVPVLFLPTAPGDEERRALRAVLACFPAAVLALFDARWVTTVDEPGATAPSHLVHLTLPRAVDRALDALRAAAPAIEQARATFPARKPEVDRAVRALLLAPPPAVTHVTRPTA